MRSMPKAGESGVWTIPENDLETLVATLNDHRLRRVGEFDLGETDLEVRAMEKAKGDKRIALVEIHFLAWMMEMILQE